MGHLFPVVEPHGGRDTVVALSVPRMVAAVQMHLRAADLPAHYSKYSRYERGLLGKSMVGNGSGQHNENRVLQDGTSRAILYRGGEMRATTEVALFG